jgi:hypothetical protein
MPGMIPFDAASIFFLVSMAGSDRRKLKGSTVFCDDSLLLGKSSFLKLCELIFRSFVLLRLYFYFVLSLHWILINFQSYLLLL